MHIQKYAVMFVMLCMAGCLKHADPDIFRGQVDVFGIEMYSSSDHREIVGVRATEEPCLKGYERSFDSLEITIGYGFDGRIRKISTRNPTTSLFGISPGLSVEKARELALMAGLTEMAPLRFKGNSFLLILLADAKSTVFGITVESVD